MKTWFYDLVQKEAQDSCPDTNTYVRIKIVRLVAWPGGGGGGGKAVGVARARPLQLGQQDVASRQPRLDLPNGVWRVEMVH